MDRIRIVWGTAHAPTAMASYDAALAEANVHNFNLVSVSSVIPDGAVIEACARAPDLGPAGDRLTVVESRATVSEGTAVAGLGWETEPSGRGIFYEASSTEIHGTESVGSTIDRGLAVGTELRDWEFTDADRKIIAADSPESEHYTTAIVLAVYGESTPIIQATETR